MLANVILITGVIILPYTGILTHNTGRQRRFLIPDYIPTACCLCDDTDPGEDHCAASCKDHTSCRRPNQYCLTKVTYKQDGRILRSRSCASESTCRNAFAETQMKPECFGSTHFNSPLVECIFCCRPQTKNQATFCIDHERNYVNFSDAQGSMPVYHIPEATSLAPPVIPAKTSTSSPTTTPPPSTKTSTSSTSSPSTATTKLTSSPSTSSTKLTSLPTTATTKSTSSTASTVPPKPLTSSSTTASTIAATTTRAPTSIAAFTSVITKTSPSMAPTTHLVSVASLQTKSVCMECTGSSCRRNPVSCLPAQPYCMNIVYLQSGGIAVLKKSCASYTECHYETLLQQQNTSECSISSNNNTITTASALCRYCCSSNSSAKPCNTDAIPKHIITFKETSTQFPLHTTPPTDANGTTPSQRPTSTQMFLHTSIPPVLPTAISTESKVSTSPSSTQHIVQATATSASSYGISSTTILPSVSLRSSTVFQTGSIEPTPTIPQPSTTTTTSSPASTVVQTTYMLYTSTTLHTTSSTDTIYTQSSDTSHTRSISPTISVSSTVLPRSTPDSIMPTAAITIMSSISVKPMTSLIQSSSSSTPRISSAPVVTPSKTATQHEHSTVNTTLMPTTQNTTNIPTTQNTTNIHVPTTQNTTNIQTTQKQTNIPTPQKQTIIPTQQNTTNIQTTQKQTNIPTTQKQTNIPTAQKTTRKNKPSEPTTQNITSIPWAPSAMTTNTKTTSNPSTNNIHTMPTRCAVCAGPVQVCESLYRLTTCQPPNNFCINTIINNIDGSRDVERKCGNYQTCYREWFLGTSDVDRCLQFDPKFLKTLNFRCTFCCTTDACNKNLVPPKDSLLGA